MADSDIFEYVREEDERVLARFSDISRDVERAGMRDFFIPATSAGVFLCLCALVSWGVFSLDAAAAGALAALGMALVSTGVIFLSIFRRRANNARGTALYITTRALVYIRGGSYIRMEYSDISAVTLESEEARPRAPFDMLACEGVRILVEYRSDTVYISCIDGASEAARLASSLLDPPRI